MPENLEKISDSEVIKNQPERRRSATEMVDLQDKDIPVPREVKTWMQKVEEDPTMTKNSGKSDGDDSILQPIATTVTKISLPATKMIFATGFAQPTDNAWRWLSTFILRIIKKSKGNVKFKEE